jgi:hypothetical protein
LKFETHLKDNLMKKKQLSLKKLELKKENLALLSLDAGKIIGGATAVVGSCALSCGCPESRNCPSARCSEFTLCK